MQTLTCKNCGKVFKTRNKIQNNCSMECRKEYIRKNKGECIFNDDNILIPIKNGIYTKIDIQDKDLTTQTISLNGAGYACYSGQLLHRLILERKLNNIIPLGYVCDHINRNRLDNTRNNLRLMPVYARNWNINKPINQYIATSKYKGVCFNKEHKSWETKIKFQDKTIFIGRFKNELDAAKAYDIKAIELYGEFASANFD